MQLPKNRAWLTLFPHRNVHAEAKVQGCRSVATCAHRRAWLAELFAELCGHLKALHDEKQTDVAVLGLLAHARELIGQV